MAVRHWALGVLFLSLGLVGCAHKKSAQSAAGLKPISYREADSQSYPMYAGEGYRGNVQRHSDGRIVNVRTAPAEQTYYFGFDQSALSAADRDYVQLQAQYLASHPHARVRLEGNTDRVGSREYNIALGWRRDQAVSGLLKQYGVSSRQINMVSYGKERPASLGDSDTDRALNRRVHLVYEEK